MRIQPQLGLAKLCWRSSLQGRRRSLCPTSCQGEGALSERSVFTHSRMFINMALPGGPGQVRPQHTSSPLRGASRVSAGRARLPQDAVRKPLLPSAPLQGAGVWPCACPAVTSWEVADRVSLASSLTKGQTRSSALGGQDERGVWKARPPELCSAPLPPGSGLVGPFCTTCPAHPLSPRAARSPGLSGACKALLLPRRCPAGLHPAECPFHWGRFEGVAVPKARRALAQQRVQGGPRTTRERPLGARPRASRVGNSCSGCVHAHGQFRLPVGLMSHPPSSCEPSSVFTPSRKSSQIPQATSD